MDTSGYASIDKLTTRESLSSVSDFSAIQGLFIDDTYL